MVAVSITFFAALSFTESLMLLSLNCSNRQNFHTHLRSTEKSYGGPRFTTLRRQPYEGSVLLLAPLGVLLLAPPVGVLLLAPLVGVLRAASVGILLCSECSASNVSSRS